MVILLGEDDYKAGMEGPCREWRERYVQQGDFDSFDGTRIHYYYAMPDGAKAIVVMFHGFCEFWGKYHEMAWYFWQEGYGFFFPEMRGHGLSGGKLPEKDLVYVGSYDCYVRDMKLLVDMVRTMDLQELPLLLFAHSMGGAIASLYLERYQDDFRGAILSSPMLRLRTKGISPAKIKLLRLYVLLCHKQKSLCVGQSRFDGVSMFEDSSCQSRARYDYIFDMRLKNEDYQTYGATFAWTLASLDATEELVRRSGEIRTPLLVFEAGDDHLVDPGGYTDFLSHLPDAKHIKYETSKHEIFNATDEVRMDYYKRVFDALASMSAR